MLGHSFHSIYGELSLIFLLSSKCWVILFTRFKESKWLNLIFLLSSKCRVIHIVTYCIKQGCESSADMQFSMELRVAQSSFWKTWNHFLFWLRLEFSFAFTIISNKMAVARRLLLIEVSMIIIKVINLKQTLD